MSRRLSPEERRLWSRVARTVRPAPGRRLEVEDDAPAASVGAEPGPALSPAAPQRSRKAGPPEDLSGQRRIRRGQSGIDARLDLHGHTQDTAHRELVSFILREHAAGSRCLLVITGKGRLGTGVLRARLFDWIGDPDLRTMIAGYARAHPRHGGEGAVYLFLKAKRSRPY
ncbi:MAG TPA: Smr/MutS family protein [Hyphomonadaceae bacterium]|jgi:DNA-nicking Smr family endonuclease